MAKKVKVDNLTDEYKRAVISLDKLTTKQNLRLSEQLKIAIEALISCDPSIHPVFVCNKIRKEALIKIEAVK